MTKYPHYRRGRMLLSLVLAVLMTGIFSLFPMQGKLGGVAYADKASSDTALKEVEVLSTKAEKKVYLTFDDGPSTHTKAVLDILQKEKVKGTFFVLGMQVKQYPKLVQRIVDEGHAIGNHSYNHNYSDLYSSFSNFWTQIRKTGQAIKDVVGYEPQLVRAPGGTFLNFDQQYFDLMKQAGYLVHDWDVDSNDSVRVGVPAREIVQGVKSGGLDSSVVVLMHDGNGHGETVKALPEIIKYYKNKGYTFEVLTLEVEPIQFRLASRDRWQRNPVSKVWIERNVAPVQVAGKPEQQYQFKVWTSNGEVTFEPDQYRTEAGATYVAVRPLVEKLNGSVSFDATKQQVVVNIGDVVWGIHSTSGMIEQMGAEGSIIPLSWKGSSYKQQIYVPLRQALDISGLSLAKYELIPVEGTSSKQ